MGSAPMPIHCPASRLAPTASQSAPDSWSISTSTPATPAVRSSSTGRPAAQQCTDDRRRRQPLDKGKDEGAADLARLDGAMPREAARCGDRATEHRRQHRLVELDQQLDIGQPPAQLGNELSDSLGKRLAEIASRSVVGEHSITARTLHHRRQRPGAGDRELDRSLVSLGVLLEQIEVSAKRADGQPMISAGGVGEPPSGRLQVDGQTGEEGSRASDHLGVRSARRKLRQVREIRALRERDLDRIRHVRTRPGADSGGPDRRQLAVRRDVGHARVAEMVALPTTREPA